jgi:hypothetical protein
MDKWTQEEAEYIARYSSILSDPDLAQKMGLIFGVKRGVRSIQHFRQRLRIKKTPGRANNIIINSQSVSPPKIPAKHAVLKKYFANKKIVPQTLSELSKILGVDSKSLYLYLYRNNIKYKK